jgi:hypothetical protein
LCGEKLTSAVSTLLFKKASGIRTRGYAQRT